MESRLAESPGQCSSGSTPGKVGGGQGKPVCKYGNQCYRKNPMHFQEYAHPDRDNKDTEEIEMQPPVTKKAKTESTSMPSTSASTSTSPDVTTAENKPPASSPVSGISSPLFYLTKVRGIPDYYNNPSMATGIKDILLPSMGELVASAQFNYMFDIPWLIQQYPESKRNMPLLIVHGEQREGLIRLKAEAKPFPNIKLFQAKLEIMFGTHHSKMMLLAYKEGMRVVIHTANLIAKDWDQKTQGVWISPVFHQLTSATSSQTSAKGTRFQQDLLDYLQAYGGSALNEWKQRIKEHDLSSARVRLIASVPGAHTGANMHKWGHLKLRKVLLQHGPPSSSVDEHWPVVGQFSSIGSLGPSSQQWLGSEWLLSLSTNGRKEAGVAVTMHKYPNLQLVFPTVENVRNSLEGYMAGGSIPYALKTSQKQPYLNDYLCHWKADNTGRSRAAPHIKTYMRVSPDCSKLAWFLVTSANLSKAAWGALEKKGTQLKIRSYEIGVLYLPSDQETPESSFAVKSASSGESTEPQILVPFDIPLTGYAKEDKPWIWDAKYFKPDSKGNMWTP